MAISKKATRSGIGGSPNRYASGLNLVVRSTAPSSIKGGLLKVGTKATPVFAVIGAFTAGYNLSIAAQCGLGVIQMSKVDDDWRQKLIERFRGREVLTKQEMYARYFNTADLQREAVFECLDLIEFEYDFPVGLLRPEDTLEKLIKPVPAANPWRWLVYRTREGDTQTEINYQLGKRMRRAGTIQSWSHVENFADLTIRDLIRAWCGLGPLMTESEDQTRSR